MIPDTDTMRPPSPVQTGIGGRCPRCGARTVFETVVRFAPSCSGCGLDYAGFNVGDGPAAFLTLIVGAIVTALAVWLELACAPDFWVHLAIWPLATLASVVLLLRIAKGMLLSLEYRNAAREGRIVERPR